jgi:hypothetical protein
MSVSRRSNLRRTEYNRKCRQKLSAHIRKNRRPPAFHGANIVVDSRLGILIEPAQVRLKTEDTNDLYTWERVKEKDHLFVKNMSDLSVGQLEELSEGVPEYISAVLKKPTRGCQNGGLLSKVCDRLPCLSKV